jgi:hypothetical protein
MERRRILPTLAVALSIAACGGPDELRATIRLSVTP